MSIRRLRVAFIDHCARLSGGELALLRMLEAMEGIDCHVLLAEDGPLVALLLASGATVEVLPMAERTRNLHRDMVGRGLLAGPRAADSLAYAVRLAARLRRIRPDIVHTNSLKSALYGGVAAKLARIPLVAQLNDRVAEDYLPAAGIRLVRSAFRWLPDAIVANSHATLTTLSGPTMQWNGPRAVVIHPPVPPFPELDCQPGTTMRIGIVGRLGPTKGQHVFLQALAQAFGADDQASGGADWEAVLVGAALFEGDERYAAELPKLARQLGIERRVRFLGFSNDVPQELAQMHILVHASVHAEPFGLVVVEAMSAGLPVVAAAAGGPAEVIEDNVTGVLYPAGDVAALADAIRRLAADPALRARLGRAAKLRSADFAPAITAGKVLAVYDSVASARGR